MVVVAVEEKGEAWGGEEEGWCGVVFSLCLSFASLSVSLPASARAGRTGVGPAKR
jgi:hypothetical protein